MPRDRFVFAHLADAHVGAWPRQPALRAALRNCVVKALAQVEECAAEFLLVSGDLFHTPTPDPAEVAPVAAALRRLVDRGTRIYAIYGSHDYVAHKTSWLDVLAEAGAFARVAPEAVRAEGTRWSLPFLTDKPTGARIAGVSGRAHGLDREYFLGMDSEAFRSATGYHVFQFHAAVEEYLPVGLREHIPGIHRSDLPPACDYYAGGHIHVAYVGEGPAGGLLVNPGTLFGTNRTDLDYHNYDAHRHGLAIVEVDHHHSSLRFFDPYPEERVDRIDVDLTARPASEVRGELHEVIARRRTGANPVVIRLKGTPTGGSLAEFGLAEVTQQAQADPNRFSFDVEDVDFGAETPATPTSEAQVEREEFDRLQREAGADREWLQGETGARRLRALLAELGTSRLEGESVADYREGRRNGALRLLDVRRIGERQ